MAMQILTKNSVVGTSELSECDGIDFITELPPELLATILSNLSIKDVVQCELVCKRWLLLIRSLAMYWKSALTCLGVPLSIYSARTAHGASYRELALRSWKGRELIRSAHPRSVCLSSSYRSASYFQCHYARFNSLVGTTYTDFVPVATVMAVIPPGACHLKDVGKFRPVWRDPRGRIVWASVFTDYLLLVSASGRWQGHQLVSGAMTLDWQGGTLYDPEIMISCCQQCYLVARVKLISSRKPKQSYWEVHLLRLGRGQVTPSQCYFQLETPFLISPLSTAYGCKRIEVLSRVEHMDSEQFCCRHWLLMQWAGHVFVHEVGMSASLVNKPLATLSSDDCTEFVSSDKSRSTPFVTSADGLLLGLVHLDKLCVWNLSSLEQEVAVPIPRRDPTPCGVCLIALGQVYSLLGYESQEGRLQVVATRTGQLVLSTHGFSRQAKGSRGTGLPPPYFTFLGPVDEHWLSSVGGGPHPSMPTILYWDKHAHRVSGIVLGQKLDFHSTVSPVHQKEGKRGISSSRKQSIVKSSSKKYHLL